MWKKLYYRFRFRFITIQDTTKYNPNTDGNSIVYKKKNAMGIDKLYVLNFFFEYLFQINSFLKT